MDLQDFMTGAYGFAAFWLILFVVITLPRRGKTREDYEVIGFRAASGFMCLAVFVRRFFEWDYTLLVIPLIAYCYTAMRNTITVGMHILGENNDARP